MRMICESVTTGITLPRKVAPNTGISPVVTVDSMDAVVELTGMYLQRVTDGDMRRAHRR